MKTYEHELEELKAQYAKKVQENYSLNKELEEAKNVILGLLDDYGDFTKEYAERYLIDSASRSSRKLMSSHIITKDNVSPSVEDIESPESEWKE